jgi:hypothetical protein
MSGVGVRTGTDTAIRQETGRGSQRQKRRWWPEGALLAVWLVFPTLAACGTSTVIPNVAHQCGTVHVAAARVLPADAAAASAAESCFAHNYASCQAAVLTVTTMGVDTGTTQTFAEHLSNGQCTVTDTVQGYTANGGGKTFPAQTYTCTGVHQQADGLHFSACGQQGEVLVPAPTPH